MPASAATVVYAALIVGLFWLDNDRRGRTSVALWLPVIWLVLAGSRSASEWLHLAPPTASPEALLEGDPLNRVVYAGLVALALAVLLFRGPNILELLQANGLVLVFLLYCVLSLTWAQYPDVGFKRWVKAVGDFLMVLIVVSERDPSLAIRRLLMRTGFLLIPLSVLMIKYYPDLARYYDRWDWSTYYSGVTTNKNALGVICLIFGLASASRFLAALYGRDQARRGGRLIAHGIMLAMVAYLFRFANSMTSLACFFVGLILLVILEMGSPRSQNWSENSLKWRPALGRLAVHVLVAMSVAVPGTILFFGIESILSMLGKNPTLTDRTEIWGLVVSLTPNTWLGAGFENFWLGPRLQKIWSVYTWGPNQAHNGYLEIFLNLGWIGVALLVITLAAGYQTVMTGLRRSPLGSLLLTYFVIGIVYNFTEAALFRFLTPAWFILLLAITSVPDFHKRKAQIPFGRSTGRTAAMRLKARDRVREHAISRSA
jgi:exopolysaccharide production protein ExoQ